MRRLICTFVIRIWLKQVFSWRGSSKLPCLVLRLNCCYLVTLQRKVLEAKLSENLVFKEFEETPKKILEYDCNVSKQPDNSQRNRFRDVLPYDVTRVKLTPRKDNAAGYINASHIKVKTKMFAKPSFLFMSQRHVWAIGVDPDLTAWESSLISFYTVCYSICIFLTSYRCITLW